MFSQQFQIKRAGIMLFCFALLFSGSQVFAGACGVASTWPPQSVAPPWNNVLCTTAGESFAGGPATFSNNGTPSDTSDDRWVWSCGTTPCYVLWGHDGVCDANYHAHVLVSAPASYCTYGTYSGLPASYDHNWNWTCVGVNGAANVNCYADQNLCGTANGGTYSSAPSSNLCTGAGTPSTVATNPDKYVWTCSTATTPSSFMCTANRSGPTTTACGSDHGGTFSTVPTNLCVAGYTASAVTTNTSTYNWSCYSWQSISLTDHTRDVAMSADGHYQTIVSGCQGCGGPSINTGRIYVSTDYGQTWTAKGPTAVWMGISMSSSGQYQTATPYDGATLSSPMNIYVSTDYGQTWVAKDSARRWYYNAMSSTGQYQIAAVDFGSVYRSTDYGNTWTATTLTSGTAWEGRPSMSSTGQYQAIAGWTAYIYVSNDYGVTWNARSSDGSYMSTSMSPDGKHMLAGAPGGTTGYYSDDYGVTWTGKSGTNFYSFDYSATGQKVVATTGNTIQYSNDFGVTWNVAVTTSSSGFYGVAMSSDGHYQTGVDTNGLVWRSANYGGDTTNACYANRIPAGQCGEASGHRFLSTDTAYTTTYDQCNLGTPTSTTFPTGGTPSNWYCNNSGANSPQCTASKNRKAVITNGTLTYPVYTSGNVTFTGFSATDADSDTLTYAWSCTNGGTFTSNTVANPQYIAPATARTDTCTLVASDGYEGTLSSTVTVTVTATPPGQCGEASGHRFLSTDTAYTTTYDQCNLGTPTSTTFPTGGTPANWYCTNSGVNSPQCTATKNRKATITNGTLNYSGLVSHNFSFAGFSEADADSDTLNNAWVCNNGGTFTNNALINPQYISSATPLTDTCSLLVSDSYEATVSGTTLTNVSNWNAGFGYRKAIFLSNSTGAGLTDYQIKLVVPYNAHMQADFDDLRFTSFDGTTALSYWLESKTDSSTATVWVKVSSVPTTGAVIYMYYGNATAVSVSSGSNTFDFFDDFTGTSIDTTKWTVTGATAASGIASVNNGQSIAMKAGVRVATPTVYEVKYQRPSYYRNRINSGPAPTGVADWGDFSPSLYWGSFSGTTLSNNAWYQVSYTYSPTTFTWNIASYGGATVFTRSAAYSGTPAYLSFAATESDSSQLRFDWTFAHKYASTLPTSAYGTEEEGGVCGTANGGTYPSAPTTGLCYVGTASSVADGGTSWTWTCTGTGGYVDSCSAIKSGSINGTCGTANGQSFASSGAIDTAAERCATGIFGGSFTDNPTTWTWSCNGSGGGTSDNGCYANKTGSGSVNGECGASDDKVFASAPTSDLCIAGTASNVSGSGPWTWTCAGIGSGSSSEICNANVSGTNFNGACGSANGHSSTTVPTTNLCSVASGGEPTPSGTGPWTWTCLGGGTGSNASCSANKSLPIWTEK